MHKECKTIKLTNRFSKLAPIQWLSLESPRHVQIYGSSCLRWRSWKIFDSTKVAVRGLVGDDDSSFRANIRHCWKDKAASPLHPNFTEADIPLRQVQSGKNKGKWVKKDDHGKLRLDLPEVVTDYCDPNHRVQIWGSVLFKLVKQSVSVNKG